jgi:hypothetical protein
MNVCGIMTTTGFDFTIDKTGVEQLMGLDTPQTPSEISLHTPPTPSEKTPHDERQTLFPSQKFRR